MVYSIEKINNNPWLGVQDVIGNANLWPKFIRKMFWDQNLDNHNRMILVNFSYLNAISEEFLHDILTFTIKNAYTSNRRREIKARFSYLNNKVILLILINELMKSILLFLLIYRNLAESDVAVFTVIVYILKKC